MNRATMDTATGTTVRAITAKKRDFCVMLDTLRKSYIFLYLA